MKAVWIKGSFSSIDIPSFYQAIRKKLLCVCVCGSMCVVADASLTLPNFKSSVSTLIFSSPALRTLGKTVERDPGSFCHSHSSFVSQRCLIFSYCCSHSVFFATSHWCTHAITLSLNGAHSHPCCLNTQPSPRKHAGLVTTYSNSLIPLSFTHTHANTHSHTALPSIWRSGLNVSGILSHTSKMLRRGGWGERKLALHLVISTSAASKIEKPVPIGPQ